MPRVVRARTYSTCPLCFTTVKVGAPILPDFKSRLHAHVSCVVGDGKAVRTALKKRA